MNFKLDSTNSNNYTKQFNGPVWTVSVGAHSLCYIVGLHNLKCYSFISHKYTPVPQELESNAKQVSVGLKQTCGVDSEDSLMCWDTQ